MKGFSTGRTGRLKSCKTEPKRFEILVNLIKLLDLSGFTVSRWLRNGSFKKIQNEAERLSDLWKQRDSAAVPLNRQVNVWLG